MSHSPNCTFCIKKSFILSLQIRMLRIELPLLIFSLCIHVSLQNNYFLPIIEEFQIKHTTIIKNENSNDVSLMKLAFEYSQFTKICRNFSNISEKTDVTSHMLIYINPRNNFEKEWKYLVTKQILIVLVLQDQQFEEMYNNLELEICHQVFLLKESSQEMYETYIINNQHIRQKLGHINLSANKFIWNTNVNSNFFKRRANFHGLVLKAMTEFSGSNMNADSSYIKNAPYFSNNETFLINGYTYGLFNDLLHTMEHKLNFTALIYKRKEITWGYIYPQPNGSYVGTGIVGDIFFKRADIAVAPLAVVLKRGLYIDYLPPIQLYKSALYTPALDASESIDLKLFFSPFTINVWIIIGVVSILTATLKFTVFCYYDSFQVLEFFSATWSSFIGFFGGKPTSKSFDSKTSYKIVVFTSLLCGSMGWIAYRSYLTSELSIRKKVLPFTDMKTFSKTNWR